MLILGVIAFNLTVRCKHCSHRKELLNPISAGT
jgi:hypothetical protein